MSENQTASFECYVVGPVLPHPYFVEKPEYVIVTDESKIAGVMQRLIRKYKRSQFPLIGLKICKDSIQAARCQATGIISQDSEKDTTKSTQSNLKENVKDKEEEDLNIINCGRSISKKRTLIPQSLHEFQNACKELQKNEVITSDALRFHYNCALHVDEHGWAWMVLLQKGSEPRIQTYFEKSERYIYIPDDVQNSFTELHHFYAAYISLQSYLLKLIDKISQPYDALNHIHVCFNHKMREKFLDLSRAAKMVKSNTDHERWFYLLYYRRLRIFLPHRKLVWNFHEQKSKLPYTQLLSDYLQFSREQIHKKLKLAHETSYNTERSFKFALSEHNYGLGLPRLTRLMKIFQCEKITRYQSPFEFDISSFNDEGMKMVGSRSQLSDFVFLFRYLFSYLPTSEIKFAINAQKDLYEEMSKIISDGFEQVYKLFLSKAQHENPACITAMFCFYDLIHRFKSYECLSLSV